MTLTASQTVGPYFHIGFEALYTTDLTLAAAQGQSITVTGTILDGDGQPIPDAVLELWQADATGRYHHPEDRRNEEPDQSFFGFGRIPMRDDGSFRFKTIKPGRPESTDGRHQAPHINVTLFMRGQLTHLVTRIYFGDEDANEQDHVLGLVDPQRRHTLVARLSSTTSDEYRWDVHMQGAAETVFFDV